MHTGPNRHPGTPAPAAGDVAATPAPQRRRWLTAFGGLALAGLAGYGLTAGAQGTDGMSVSLEAARAALTDGHTVVIDIREPAEHATGVAAGMRLLPMSQIGARLTEIPNAEQTPVLLICNTQNRSRKVVDALRARGWNHVRYVNGGMSGWAAKGWPLVKPGS